MSFKDLQKMTYEQAEKDAGSLYKYLLESYNAAQEEIIFTLEKVYGKFLTTKDPQDYYNIMIQYDRLNKLLNDVQVTYSKYAKQAGIYIQQISSLAMSNVYYRQQYLLNWITPENINFRFTTLSPDLVEFAVTGTIESWNRIKKLVKSQYGNNIAAYQPQYGTLIEILHQNKIQDIAKINQIITQAFIQGYTINQMSKNIQGVMDNAYWKSERIARTEFTRTANAGEYAAAWDASNQGLNIKRIWIASLDDRTRASHARLDGQKVGIDEKFKSGGYEAYGPGGFGVAKMDIHCRCTVATMTDGEDLELRAARDPVTGKHTVIDFKSFGAWADENGLKQNKFGEYYSK